MDGHNLVGAKLSQPLLTLSERRKTHGWQRWLQDRHRVRIEHDRDDPASRTYRVASRLNKPSVAQMDAVKVADGDRSGAGHEPRR